MTCKNCKSKIMDKGVPLVKGMSASELKAHGLPYVVIVQCGNCASTFSTETASN